METQEYRLTLVQAETAQVSQYLRALPPEAWSRPSACHRWAVHDVVGHWIMSVDLHLGWVFHGLQGDATPPDGFPEAGTVNAVSVAALVDQLSVARRESLGEQLLATFIATSDQWHQVLAGCGPQDWETRCYHPAGIVPVRTFVDMRLTELVMHGWDIRSRLDREAHLTPESFPAFLELITGPFGWPRWAFCPGERHLAPVRYRFDIMEPVPFRTDLIVAGEQAHLEPVSVGPANLTLTCAMEPFILLLCGRLSLPDAVATGRIAADGDAGLIPAFAQWFRGL